MHKDNQEKITVKIKKLSEDAVIPEYAHEGDSGMDIYSTEDIVIPAGERRLVGSGLSFEIPIGYEIQVRPKSGLAANFGITNLNAPGTIDSNYRGEVKGILFNSGKEAYHVKKHSKIFQIVLQKVSKMEIEEAEELNDTSRGHGGFGSTGLHHKK